MIDPEIFFMNHLTLLLFKRETDCYFVFVFLWVYSTILSPFALIDVPCLASSCILAFFYSCIGKLCGQETICTNTPNNLIIASIHCCLHFPRAVSVYTWLRPINHHRFPSVLPWSGCNFLFEAEKCLDSFHSIPFIAIMQSSPTWNKARLKVMWELFNCQRNWQLHNSDI